MKMKTNKFMTYALSAMMLGSLAACSSDDSEPDNGGNSGGETTDTPYVWGTEGSIKTCDHLLFNEDKSENKKGTVIGICIQRNPDPCQRYIPVERMGLCGSRFYIDH